MLGKIANYTLGVTIGLSLSLPAQAALMIHSQSAVANLDTQKVIFTIEFNEVPDFFTVDEFNRQADSFQYYIDADGNLPVFGGSPYYSGLEAIIRGAEIPVAGDIRVRNVFPSSDEPTSGGWGSFRGSVPYTLNGTVLTFSTPLQLIGDSDGLFSYQLLLTEFGGSTDYLDAKSVVNSTSVPECSSSLSVLAFGVLGASSLLKFQQKKQKLAS
ncbi:hypothetical protein [Floridanema aerugineum]|uniref:PEP-CTERM sorting domain-containing protein n=1 Tax=Floridaenema aerugineum BLCC-F46 TaxID=3153654 RepID=A0ABV4WYK5_9CYAN